MKQQSFDHALVVLDSSSPIGDDGATLAASLLGADGRITLTVSLSGPEASGLSAFAAAEEMPIPEAAKIYLGQVAERLSHPRVSATAVDGTDFIADLIALVDESNADVVVLPAPLASRVMATKRAWAILPFPVVVVPGRPAAA